jgi:hypothetical protein
VAPTYLGPPRGTQLDGLGHYGGDPGCCKNRLLLHAWDHLTLPRDRVIVT